jgi:hypothetical protein
MYFALLVEIKTINKMHGSYIHEKRIKLKLTLAPF